MNSNKIKYKIVSSRQGLPTLIVCQDDNKEFPLHSKFNPSRESESFKDKFIPEKYDVLIVLGIGLGYHLLPLKDYLDNYSLVILIDKLENIENEILKNELTSFLSKSNKIKFITGKSIGSVQNNLIELINMDTAKGISVLEHSASIRLFTNYYNQVNLTIEKIINQKAGNIATQKAFSLLYFRNILKNISFLENCKYVSDFFDQFHKYDCIVITSGPSLEKYIDLLKKNKNKYFLISVDSALSVLYKYNIHPDFVISVDPQPYIYEHYQSINLIDTIPVLSISASHYLFNSKIGNQFPGKIISMNTHPLSQVINEAYPGIGSIDSLTGSVAGDAVNFAIKLGFKRIGLIGFDFSFSNFKIYSKGTAYQKRYSLYFQDRVSTVEGFNAAYIMKSSKGYKHSGKFTRRSFIQYKESLEDFIENKFYEKIFNINSYGIQINGVKETKFEEFNEDDRITNISKKEIIESVMNKAMNIKQDLLLKNLKNILNREHIFKELMQASLGELNEKKKEKFQKIVNSI